MTIGPVAVVTSCGYNLLYGFPGQVVASRDRTKWCLRNQDEPPELRRFHH